jgi:carbamoyltransferase
MLCARGGTKGFATGRSQKFSPAEITWRESFLSARFSLIWVASYMFVGLASSFHDPAMAIVDYSGRVLFAQATERELQDKRAINSPPDRFNSVHRALGQYVDPDVKKLVVATSWSSSLFSPRELAWLFRTRVSGRRGIQWLTGTHIRAVRAAGTNLQYMVASALVQNRNLGWVIERESHDHHMTHAATAAFTSPFESAACAIVDGAGQGTSSSFYAYNHPTRLNRIRAPVSVSSLGLFYSLLCEWCGFDSFQGEEWKVMGLAAYGEVDERIRNDLRRLIGVKGLQITYPAGRSEYRRLVGEFSARRRRPDQDPLECANLARTGQAVFSEVLIALLRNLHEIHPSRNLVAGGGCFLNSAFNGLITEQTPFEQVHVFAAPADDGNALGAAFLSAASRGSALEELERPLSPFLGSEPNAQSLARIVTEGAIRYTEHLDDVPRQVAALLANGLIVGWMRGKAEFGPRALGARSILADPRSKALSDKINDKVKYRESFRPLAPSILEGHEDAYFARAEVSPYMERALAFSASGAAAVPGVVHVDGTGRVQSVKQTWNPVYFATIEEFRRITGVPGVINTSLNVMGKPIVHTVEDAMAVFIGSGLDAIVIEDQLFTKSPDALNLARGALTSL